MNSLKKLLKNTITLSRINLPATFVASSITVATSLSLAPLPVMGQQASAASSTIEADTLARRASWQAKFKTPNVSENEKNSQQVPTIGRQISTIEQGSPLALAGLKVGDILLSVDSQTINSSEDWYDINDALVANHNYQLTVLRGGIQQLIANVSFNAVSKEQYSHLDTSYQTLISPYGIRQRLIITKPKAANSNKPYPAIFMAQGLSCSSIEVTPGRSSNYGRLIKDLVTKSNMVMMRIEKPGVGDSEGNCSKTDFYTELSGYEVALKYLKNLSYVNANKIVIYGSSMGSALAPYLANKYQANAVISDGTFFRTWFEHMLEIERRIKAMQGLSESEITQQMNQAYIPLYYGMLIEKRSYQELITANPLLAEYNYHGAEHMYGRPMSYYQQMQDFDFAGQWQQLKVPLRVRWGTNDWIMSESDNDMIVATLKAKGHKNVELYKYPGLDHWETIHKTASDSFHGKKGVWQDKISQQVIDWAKELNQ